ncbi:ribose-5-phosphate isomerase [Amylibacter ulvae]|uniref:Ribose-5-phosphate isomerase n=1 Tax=Paramylibacter ulvae TaxID=1651968 RepID=A0ABQ3D011_9RHOB|nr:RpiB/LacA/LacB family sugar-phosphate isomerase [Amylibacter ulvae]GHA44270.1 ribose-5-phosphate isomerase [Amylibacter ulvae]
MKLAIAGDSAGATLAQILTDHLSANATLEVVNLSAPPDGSVEYYANLSDRVCNSVINGQFDRAILVCGTGIGVCIAANKVPGIRAALAHDTYSAGKATTSNNAQVITMGARVIGAEIAKNIADVWLQSVFDANGASSKNVEAIDRVGEAYQRKV